MLLTNRYWSAGFLAGIIALPLLFILLLQGLQHHAQHEAKERLEKEALVTLKLAAHELHWYKKGKEILIDGQLFDVKTLVQKGNEVIVTGLFDKKENDIVKALHRQTERSGKSGSIIRLLVLIQHFVSVGETYTFALHAFTLRTFSLTAITSYKSPALSVLAPPPRQ